MEYIVGTEYERETSALNAAITGTPTANSIHDMLNKDANLTYDKLTDSLEALSETIASITVLTNKEKAFLNLNMQRSLIERFDNTAVDAVDSNFWTEIIGNSSVFTIINIGNGYANLQTGSTAGADGIIHTDRKIIWRTQMTDCTKLCMRFRFKVDDLTGNYAVGFLDQGTAPATAKMANGESYRSAGLYINNDVAYFHTGDGQPDDTDISAAISGDDTWYEIKIEISPSSAVIYVDDVLTATHTVDIPIDRFLQALYSCKNTNSIRGNISIEFIEVWNE